MELDDINFDNSLSLPVANESNRGLQKEVNEKEKKVNKFKIDIDDLEQRSQAIWDLMRDIRQELAENRILGDTKRTQLDSERQTLALVQRELEKALQDCKTMEASIKDFNDTYSRQEKALVKQTKELEKGQMNSKYNFDSFQSELNSVLDADDLNVEVQKYLLKDEKTITSYNIHLEKLQDDRLKLSKSLERLQTEYAATVLKQEKTNTELTQCQTERAKLIMQWEAAMKLNQQRDSETEKINNNLSSERSSNAEYSNSVKSRESELKEFDHSATSLIRQINQLDVKQSRLRKEITTMETKRVAVDDEVATNNQLLSNITSQIKSSTTQVRQLKESNDLQNEKLESLKQTKQQVNASIEESDRQSTGTKQSNVERQLKVEENLQTDLQRQKNQMTEQLKNQKIKRDATRMEEDRLNKCSNDVTLKTKTLKGKLKQISSELQKLTEAKHSLNSEISTVEKQLQQSGSQKSLSEVNGDGEVTRIENFKLQLSQKEGEFNHWNGGVAVKKTEIKAMKTAIEQEEKRKDQNQAKLTEVTLVAQNFEKERNRVVHEKQELLVQLNLLKLEAKRFTENLMDKQDAITSVEKYGLDSKHTLIMMQEQTKANREMLQAELILLEDEKKLDNLTIGEISNKVDQIKNKYEILTIGLKPPSGEKGTIEDYYQSKTQKEHDEMEKQTFELQKKIQKSENEIQALNNTLALINSKNASFRQNITQISKSSIEYQEKYNLEQNCKDLQDQYKEQRRKIRDSQVEAETFRKKQSMMDEDIVKASKEPREHTRQINKLNQEIVEQEQKLDRWAKQAVKSETLFKNSKQKNKKINEKDIKLRDLTYHNQASEKIVKEILQNGDKSEIYELLQEEFDSSGLNVGTNGSIRQRSSSQSAGSGKSHDSTVKSTVTSSTVVMDAKKMIPNGVNIQKSVRRRSFSLNRIKGNRPVKVV